jgi:hypothetical protein
MQLINTDRIIKAIKTTFSKATVEISEIDSEKAKELVTKNSIKFIPYFIFDNKVKDSVKYQQFAGYLKKKGSGYIINPAYIPNRYYFSRAKHDSALEFFVNSKSNIAMQLENIIMSSSNYSFAINYNVIVSQRKNKDQLLLSKDADDNMKLSQPEFSYNIGSKYGESEIRENIKQLCINKYHPEIINSYLRCHNNDSIRRGKESKCDDLVLGMKMKQISECMDSGEGIEMLAKNSYYSKSFNLSSEIAVLIKNQFLLQEFEVNHIFQLMGSK